jgi:hypothetical protein
LLAMSRQLGWRCRGNWRCHGSWRCHSKCASGDVAASSDVTAAGYVIAPGDVTAAGNVTAVVLLAMSRQLAVSPQLAMSRQYMGLLTMSRQLAVPCSMLLKSAGLRGECVLICVQARTLCTGLGRKRKTRPSATKFRIFLCKLSVRQHGLKSKTQVHLASRRYGTR